jgi:hypothetical protein
MQTHQGPTDFGGHHFVGIRYADQTQRAKLQQLFKKFGAQTFSDLGDTRFSSVWHLLDVVACLSSDTCGTCA